MNFKNRRVIGKPTDVLQRKLNHAMQESYENFAKGKPRKATMVVMSFTVTHIPDYNVQERLTSFEYADL
jgi:hypothetical protein